MHVAKFRWDRPLCSPLDPPLYIVSKIWWLRTTMKTMKHVATTPWTICKIWKQQGICLWTIPQSAGCIKLVVGHQMRWISPKENTGLLVLLDLCFQYLRYLRDICLCVRLCIYPCDSVFVCVRMCVPVYPCVCMFLCKEGRKCFIYWHTQHILFYGYMESDI